MTPSAVLIDNRRWLWLVIYSRLGDSSNTEDVLQEVAVAAATSNDDFPEPQNAKNWLYRVAIRQVMLFRRKQSRDRSKLRQYFGATQSDGHMSFVDWICTDETKHQVRGALSQLRSGDRQVLAMKYGEDYSCKEIASVLGVSETTIQSRLLRARRRLKTLLIHQYEFEDPGNE